MPVCCPLCGVPCINQDCDECAPCLEMSPIVLNIRLFKIVDGGDDLLLTQDDITLPPSILRMSHSVTVFDGVQGDYCVYGSHGPEICVSSDNGVFSCDGESGLYFPQGSPNYPSPWGIVCDVNNEFFQDQTPTPPIDGEVVWRIWRGSGNRVYLRHDETTGDPLMPYEVVCPNLPTDEGCLQHQLPNPLPYTTCPDTDGAYGGEFFAGFVEGDPRHLWTLYQPIPFGHTHYVEIWSKSGGTLAPVECPPDNGACCFPNNYCTIYDSAYCDELGGNYLGEFTSCSDCPTAPTGTCCMLSGQCHEVTELACAAFDGDWFPDRSCDPSSPVFVQCAEPGACCFADATCIDNLLPEACSGKWQGSATTCDDVECLPSGACCVGSQCMSTTDEAGCENAGGTYQGDGIDCAPELCAEVDPTGVCCYADGSCVPDLTFEECADSNGYHFEDGGCSQCPEVGACCLFGECVETTEVLCFSQGGSGWIGGSNCLQGNPCIV